MNIDQIVAWFFASLPRLMLMVALIGGALGVLAIAVFRFPDRYRKIVPPVLLAAFSVGVIYSIAHRLWVSSDPCLDTITIEQLNGDPNCAWRR